jgi:trigger factor
MARVETQVEELPENRVRLTVEVPVADVQHAVEHAASDLAGSLKIPGFRKGKVPMPVLFARVGKERVYSEAVESHIGGWFRNAAVTSRIRPVAKPEYEYEVPTSADASFSFTATVAVQPKIEPPDWTKLEVPAAEPELPPELVEQELNALRDSVAELAPAERPAQPGDTVVVDLVGPSGEAQRDYVVELGSGRLVDEIEAAIVGMSAGDTKQVEYELADESTANIEVAAKEVKEKVLPPLDDDLARAASEFDTLAELRADIESRLGEQLEQELDSEFRAATVEALVRAADVRPSAELVRQRASGLLGELLQSLERRGITFETYLAVSNQTTEQVQERLVAQAAGSLAGELVLEAVADKLGIQVTDDDIAVVLREQEESEETIRQVLESNLADRIRDDLRLRRALDRVAAEVKRIPVDLARAREKLWTPEKEKRPADTNIWTPGQQQGGERT